MKLSRFIIFNFFRFTRKTSLLEKNVKISKNRELKKNVVPLRNFYLFKNKKRVFYKNFFFKNIRLNSKIFTDKKYVYILRKKYNKIISSSKSVKNQKILFLYNIVKQRNDTIFILKNSNFLFIIFLFSFLIKKKKETKFNFLIIQLYSKKVSFFKNLKKFKKNNLKRKKKIIY